MFSDREDVPQKKGMDLWKQMSSKCSFTCICGIVLPLNPSATTVYARSAFYPNLHFTLSLQSAFYTQSAFYPWSAVCSLLSAVCVLHWPIIIHWLSARRNVGLTQGSLIPKEHILFRTLNHSIRQHKLDLNLTTTEQPLPIRTNSHLNFRYLTASANL